MIYWIFLFCAIISEIIGTLSMKYASINGGITGDIVMYVMIACSYIFLSISIKKIALGVAYALWEGFGALIITFFSVMYFQEHMSVMKAAGLILLLIGIGLVKSGTHKPESKKENVKSEQTEDAMEMETLSLEGADHA